MTFNAPPSPNGEQYPGGQAPQFLAEPAQAKKKRRWPWIVFAVVAVLIVLFIVTATSRGSDSPSDTAINACQDIVSGELAAPSSAKFTGDDVVTEVAADTWTVAGSVDSQNALGVMLRAKYSCTVRHESGTQYNVVVDSLTQ